MKSFISWVIANFEGIIFFGVCVISAIFPFCFVNDIETIGEIIYSFAMIMFFITIVTFQTKSIMAGVFKYLLGVAFTIWGTKFCVQLDLHSDVLSILLDYFGLIRLLFMAGSVIGLISAIYAYSNFNDVISRRILYHNSNVSLFEMRWSYVIDRFTNISFTTFIHFCWLRILMEFMNHMQYLYDLIKLIKTC